MGNRLSFYEQAKAYDRFPAEQQEFALWMGEKAMDAGLDSRSMIRGKCLTLLLFLLSGVVGICGFLMTQEVRLVFLPLAVLGVCLSGIAAYLFFFVRTSVFEVPYSTPFERFSVSPEKGSEGYAGYVCIQLATFDYCVQQVSVENERTADAFDLALVLSFASAVFCTVIFVALACCS